MKNITMIQARDICRYYSMESTPQTYCLGYITRVGNIVNYRLDKGKLVMAAEYNDELLVINESHTRILYLDPTQTKLLYETLERHDNEVEPPLGFCIEGFHYDDTEEGPYPMVPVYNSDDFVDIVHGDPDYITFILPGHEYTIRLSIEMLNDLINYNVPLQQYVEEGIYGYKGDKPFVIKFSLDEITNLMSDNAGVLEGLEKYKTFGPDDATIVKMSDREFVFEVPTGHQVRMTTDQLMDSYRHELPFNAVYDVLETPFALTFTVEDVANLYHIYVDSQA